MCEDRKARSVHAYRRLVPIRSDEFGTIVLMLECTRYSTIVVQLDTAPIFIQVSGTWLCMAQHMLSGFLSPHFRHQYNVRVPRFM